MSRDPQAWTSRVPWYVSEQKGNPNPGLCRLRPGSGQCLPCPQGLLASPRGRSSCHCHHGGTSLVVVLTPHPEHGSRGTPPRCLPGSLPILFQFPWPYRRLGHPHLSGRVSLADVGGPTQPPDPRCVPQSPSLLPTPSSFPFLSHQPLRPTGPQAGSHYLSFPFPRGLQGSSRHPLPWNSQKTGKRKQGVSTLSLSRYSFLATPAMRKGDRGEGPQGPSPPTASESHRPSGSSVSSSPQWGC